MNPDHGDQADTVDHRALLGTLTSAERAALSARRDLPGLLRLAGHTGAIAAVGGTILLGPPLWPLLVVVQGILLIFLFTPLHETIHGTAFRSTWLNAVVAHATGFLLLLPPAWFRYFHLAHHRHTQDPEQDPELIQPKPETPLAYLRHLSGIPTWWSQCRTLLRNASGLCDDVFVPRGARRRITREAQAFLAAYAVLAIGSVALGSGTLLVIWLIPVLLGQPFLRAYLLAEHGRCAFVANMLENSRTTFTSRLMRLLAWNMPYHTEHHVWPAVPFHRLPEFHRYTQAYLRETEQGYRRFHQRYVRSLRRPR